MKNRYFFSIFTFLGFIVVVIMFLSFKYTDSVNTPPLEAIEASSVDDTSKMPDTKFTKDSWLGRVTKETNQKSYFFAVSEIQIELN